MEIKKKIHEENKRCVGPGCQNTSSYSKIVTVKDKFLMRIRTLDKQRCRVVKYIQKKSNNKF